MENVIADVIAIIEAGRQKAYTSINTAMVEAYWLSGRRVVEEELQGQDRTEYGKSIIKSLSEALTKRFGAGYSLSALYDFKKFYMTFSDEKIFHTVCGKLSWSAAEQNWGVRTLERNINTLYYQRLLSSQDKKTIEEEMQEKIRDYHIVGINNMINPDHIFDVNDMVL